MAKKVFTDESLKTLIDETKTYIDSSIQTPDWNQNNESAKDYIKNRPFGMVTVENEIINTNLNFTAVERLDNIYFTEDFTSVQFTKGMTYNVYWNGEQYSCVALDGGDDYVYIGNYHMSPDWELAETIESNEPFFIVTNSDFLHSLASTSSDTPVTLQVTEMVEAVKQIDEKFLPDNLATEEYVDSQISTPDWNQNDENATDYIKNRPFYEDSNIERIELFAEQSLTIDNDYIRIDTNIPQLTVGKTYCVVLNGVEYHCIAREYGSTVLIGNGTIYGDGNVGNNEPFACDSYQEGDIYLNAEKGQYTMSMHIYEENTNIRQLDEKFIPDTIARKDDINRAVDGAKDYIILKDSINSYEYIITMQNGNIVSYPVTTGIELTNNPDKTEYFVGASFDITGMQIMASGVDGNLRDVTNEVTCLPEVITSETTSVDIVYTECGKEYVITIPVTIRNIDNGLIDFVYTENSDGTYTITDWKQTLNGEPSTELVVPDSSLIKL